MQVGDPFTEKLLLEACLELMRTDAIVGIQDMGAAGLTSSAVEMAGRGGSGVELELANVPLREQGMTPYEILLSESQERMLLVAHPEAVAQVQAIFQRWDLDAVVVGRVIDEPVFQVLSEGRTVASIPVAALTDAAPAYDRPAARPARQDDLQRLDVAALPQPESMNRVLAQLLESPNIASREWVYQQYDHYVRSNTVVAPGADAAVVRIKGTSKALALTVDCNGRYCHLDPHTGGMAAVAEAARNLACVGATPLGLTGLPELRQPRAGRRDVAVLPGDPRHARGVPGAGDTGGERQRQLLQRDRGDIHPSHAHGGHGGAFGERRAHRHAVVQGGGRPGGAVGLEPRRVGRQRVPEGGPRAGGRQAAGGGSRAGAGSPEDLPRGRGDGPLVLGP